MMEVFKECDLDQDGKIEKQDLKPTLRKLGKQVLFTRSFTTDHLSIVVIIIISLGIVSFLFQLFDNIIPRLGRIFQVASGMGL